MADDVNPHELVKLPPWVWRLVQDISDFEEEHSKVAAGGACLGEALARVPEDVRNTAYLLKHLGRPGRGVGTASYPEDVETVLDADGRRICPRCGKPGWDGVDLKRTSWSGCPCCGFCH